MTDYRPTIDANGIRRRGADGPPYIRPPGADKDVLYQRISTLAKKLDDPGGLITWKANVTAVGVAKSTDIASQLAVLASTVPDPVKDPDTKGRVGSLATEAFKAAGGEKAANTGTSIHKLTEIVDGGAEPEFVPDELRPVLEAYRWATTGIEHLLIEQFVVVDEVRAAGSCDRYVRLPDGRVVAADLKTGAREPAFPAGVTCQVAMYAHGQCYDPKTYERNPIHPDLDVTTGLLIHCPLAPVDGRYVCDIYELDLVAGWDRAVLAATVRDLPKIPKPRKLVSL